MKTITYTYRGGVEVGTGNGYRWADGYSETKEDGSILYPWLVKGECQQDAKQRGAKAVFVESSRYKLGTRAQVAIQCIHPELNRKGSWLFTGDDHRQIGSAVSPLFEDLSGVCKWAHGNGWQLEGEVYVKIPTPRSEAA